MTLNYWFDQQFRRFLLQFGRVFANFQYQTGVQSDGSTQFITVPVTMAQTNNMVSSIIQNNSQNTLQTTPQITFYIKNLVVARERTQHDGFVEPVQIYEREFDQDTQQYTSNLGNTYSLQRIMAVPFNIEMQVDIWTSNQLQLDQLLEQILVMFNPAIELNSDTNVFDWSALTYVELTDIQYNSRTIPVGSQTTTDNISITSLMFRVPFWLAPPAKLKKQSIIQRIVDNIGEIYNMQGFADGYDVEYSPQDLLARVITTPGDYQISVSGNVITLLSSKGSLYDDNGNIFSWALLLDRFGQIRPGISQLILRLAADDEDPSDDVTGVIQLSTTSPNQLIWTANPMTLPANTLGAITGIINPHSVFPGSGLPPAVAGQRYLIVSPVGSSVGWGTITAKTNDIIQYDGTTWFVAFTASASAALTEYMLNLATGKQLKWNGENWILAIDGTYTNGYWRVLL
jgi:hypothetical protein